MLLYTSAWLQYVVYASSAGLYYIVQCSADVGAEEISNKGFVVRHWKLSARQMTNLQSPLIYLLGSKYQSTSILSEMYTGILLHSR